MKSFLKIILFSLITPTLIMSFLYAIACFISWRIVDLGEYWIIIRLCWTIFVLAMIVGLADNK